MWYCGDVPNNIPPYKMLRSCYVAHFKNGKSKISNMKKIKSNVERGATIVNQTDIVKSYWTFAYTFSLYHAVKNLFVFHSLRVGKKRRHGKILWKNYYNILSKQKGKLMGEEQNLQFKF